MSTLDGLFMDFYGTLVYGEPPIEAICCRVIDEHRLPITPEELRAAWNERFLARLEVCSNNRFQTVHRINCDTLAECVRSLAGRDIDTEAFAAAIGDWLRSAPIFDETHEVLDELRRLGGRVWIVSNADHEDALATLRTHDIRVDGIVTSESARSYKPDAAIFRRALDQTGWSPRRIIHTGDSLHHDVGGAQVLGLRTAWVYRGTRPGDMNSLCPDYCISDLRGLLPPVKEMLGNSF